MLPASSDMSAGSRHEPLAIIGMAGRFPGARDVRALWTNLCRGIESVESLCDEQLLAAGVTREMLSNPAHVRARAIAEGLDHFDAEFFGVSPRESEIMDPQLRLGLETVWEALEDAGLDPTRDGAEIGVFMAASLSSYLLNNLLPNRSLIERVGAERFLILNDKDFYPTTISYRLNLQGPSVSVGTACSSSLVAVRLACQSLIAGECRIAIAGGSSVHVPFGRGYEYTKDGIYSPDGRCRPFDAAAQGTVGGDGAAFVVLKRYRDAIGDRDRIHALVLGGALNNDGSAKAGFTAPGVRGQSAVIRAALANAGVNADEIGYVEAHGTGTTLGDPIEFAALTEAFREDTQRSNYCALGSLKANVGHLDAAAGVAGLIKAALVVRDGLAPPAVNFETPNPHIDLPASPFFINTTLRPWSGDGRPRRAGVSAFGVGGTNVHIIVQEAPADVPRADGEGPWIFPISARCERDFREVAERLRDELTGDHLLGDMEFTLGRGRKVFQVRRAFVGSTSEELAGLLAVAAPGPAPERPPALRFFAPPRGSAPEAIGRDLFAREGHFRRAALQCLDLVQDRRCAEQLLRSFENADGEGGATTPGAGTVREFVFQYALATMMTDWGVKPDGIFGLDVGELVARSLSRSLDLADALSLACQLDGERPTDRALLVKLSERDLAAILPQHVSIAAVCAPEVSVIEGPAAVVEPLHAMFAQAGVASKWLRHSPSIALTALGGAPEGMPSKRGGPQVGIVEALQSSARESALWIELGTGRTLGALLRRNGLGPAAALPGLSARPHVAESARALEWLAALWERGVEVDWASVLEYRGGRICSLRTYPFQSRRHWIDPLDHPNTCKQDESRDEASILSHQELERVERAALQRRGPITDMPEALREGLDRLVIDIGAGYLLGRGIGDGTHWDFNDLASHLGVLPKFRRCLEYLIHVLKEEGLVSPEGDCLVFRLRAASAPGLSDSFRALQERFREYKGLIALVEHCARHLPDALTKDQGGLMALYPNGSDELIRASMAETASYGALPLCVETLCRWVAEYRVPSLSRRVRILEVGMGQGNLTWNIAPLLRDADVEYVATDVTKAMIMDAEKRARRERIPWMKFQLYDLRREPAGQGFEPGSFDLILGLDVLHVVPKLAETLARLRRLLAPGGALGVIESTNMDRWPNLIWGLTEGWWAFEDRERGPLMSAERWQAVLRAAGFADVTLAPQTTEPKDCALLLAEGEWREEDRRAREPEAPVVRWVDAPPKRDDIGSWFYAPMWEQWTPPAPNGAPPSQRWLLFANDEPVSAAMERALRDAGQRVVVARQDAAPGRRGPCDYRIRADRPEDYTTLVDDLMADGGIDGILHAWTVRPAIVSDTLHRIASDHAEGVHSLLFLMQALGRSNVTAPLRLCIVANNTQEVGGGDLLRPVQASLKGVAKIIPQEYPNVRCVHVDLDGRQAFDKADAGRLVAVLQSDTLERFLASRDHQWFRPDFAPAQAAAVAAAPSLRERGVYLITGGLGGVGLALAECLAREARARLVLLGRTGMPPRSEWKRYEAVSGVIGDRVRRIEQIEALGAEVLALAADLGDRRRMEQVLREAEERFGPIQGVIHAAAVADTAGVMQRRSRRSIERAMAAKVQGALVLDALLANHPLDFFVLCSALGATVYNLKFGEVGYVAANDFLNAYSHYLRSTRGVSAMTISWTDWLEVGMAAEALTRLGQAREEAGDVDHPLWERRRQTENATEYNARVHAAAHWIFYGHRIAGCPTLPGTGTIELIASAYCAENGSLGCEIRNLSLLFPVAVEEWRAADLRLTIEARGDASRCTLSSTDDCGQETTHATGFVGRLVSGADRLPLPIDAIRARCSRSLSFAAGERQRPSVGIEHSNGIDLDARWDVVRQVWLGANEGLARLELGAEFTAELREFRWHPALLDSAVAFLNHVIAVPGARYLPIGYERIRLRGPLEPVLYSHGRWTASANRGGEMLRFDFMIADATGGVIAEIDGLTVRRVSPAAVAEVPARPVSHRLEIGQPGMLSTLGFRRFVAPEPPPRHVEIEVMAAGLNFKEVLTALGLIDRGRPFGLECAGIVTRVGADVLRWKPGDEVIGFGAQWMMPLACVPETWLQSKPAALGFEEAATVPVAFTVAYHALVHEARLRRGETVLIHSGCGGVGLAAIQIARRLSARIMATAGTEAKRAFLRNIGVECVSDSRTPDFARDALAWTGGRGVDVVLNSLGGDLLDHGLDALAPRGRFVELGRRDLAENRSIGMQRLAKGLQFLPVLPDPNDPAFAEAWSEVIRLFLDRELTPLPYHSFGAERIAEAFEEMSKGEHVGKLVLAPNGVYPPVSWHTRAGARGEMDSVVRSLVQGMTPTEGAEAFRRALALGLPEILVSTQDLNAMLRQQEIVSEHGHEAFWSVRKRRVERGDDTRGAATGVRERPDAGLEADVDARLRDIWQDLLGVADIGPDDDFFDLGGDSLIAVRMIERMKKALDVEQTLESLFEASTFRQMSDLIRSAHARPPAV